jgi:hypothetical protein
VRYDNDVVELRTDACCCTRRLSDGQTGCRCRPHVVGSNAEREADHWTTLMADALVDPRAGVPSRAVVMNQQTQQRLVRYCNSGAIAVESDEIDPHAPEVPSLTGPSHGPTLASSSRQQCDPSLFVKGVVSGLAGARGEAIDCCRWWA